MVSLGMLEILMTVAMMSKRKLGGNLGRSKYPANANVDNAIESSQLHGAEKVHDCKSMMTSTLSFFRYLLYHIVQGVNLTVILRQPEN